MQCPFSTFCVQNGCKGVESKFIAAQAISPLAFIIADANGKGCQAMKVQVFIFDTN
jgi:hypothetical protein